jgi:hypothetical protein
MPDQPPTELLTVPTGGLPRAEEDGGTRKRRRRGLPRADRRRRAAPKVDLRGVLRRRAVAGLGPHHRARVAAAGVHTPSDVGVAQLSPSKGWQRGARGGSSARSPRRHRVPRSSSCSSARICRPARPRLVVRVGSDAADAAAVGPVGRCWRRPRRSWPGRPAGPAASVPAGTTHGAGRLSSPTCWRGRRAGRATQSGPVTEPACRVRDGVPTRGSAWPQPARTGG